MPKIYFQQQWDDKKVYISGTVEDMSLLREGQQSYFNYSVSFQKGDTTADPKRAIRKCMKMLLDEYKVKMSGLEQTNLK